MKSRIASALAVLACLGALAACSGKSPSASDTGVPAGATATSTAANPAEADPAAADPSGSAGSSQPGDDLSSIDQQLSDVDGAISSAEPTHTADDNG